MKKILALIMMFFAACVPMRPPVTPLDDFDQDAYEARQEMRQAVFIQTSYHAKGHLVMTVPGLLMIPTAKDVDEDKSWGGTGVILDVKGKRSLILTNAHVVMHGDVEETPYGNLALTNFKYFVHTFDGEKCDAQVLKFDPKVDLALIVADCNAGEKAELADSLPPLAARVQQVGCPWGYHAFMGFHVTDGRYIGLDTTDNPLVPKSDINVEMLSTASTHGSSGSGVYFRGKLVGIVSMVNSSFEHLTFAIPLSFVQNYVKDSLEAW